MTTDSRQAAWDDEYNRWSALRAAADAAVVARMNRLALRESAPPEARHEGTDGAAHHWAKVTRLRCPCGCQAAGAVADDSTDPLDILARQIVDPLTAYENEVERRRLRDEAEAQDWLTAHYPRNLGPS